MHEQALVRVANMPGRLEGGGLFAPPARKTTTQAKPQPRAAERMRGQTFLQGPCGSVVSVSACRFDGRALKFRRTLLLPKWRAVLGFVCLAQSHHTGFANIHTQA